MNGRRVASSKWHFARWGRCSIPLGWSSTPGPLQLTTYCVGELVGAAAHAAVRLLDPPRVTDVGRSSGVARASRSSRAFGGLREKWRGA